MAEGDVHCESLNGEIEVKHAMTSYEEDLQNVGGAEDCNGEGQEDGVNDNVKDHTDSSYVFVNGSDVVTDDPGERDPNVDHVDDELNLSKPNPTVDSNHEDVEIRDVEMKVENAGSFEEGNYILHASDVSPSDNDVVLEENSIVESNGDQVVSSDAVEEQNQTVAMESAEPHQVDCEVNGEEQIKLESPAEVEEIQVYQTVVSKEDKFELPCLDVGKVKVDEKNNTKLGESELNNGEQGDGEGDFMSESAKDRKENEEPEDIVSEDVQLDLDPGKEMAEIANDIPAEGPLVDIGPNLKMASSPEINIQLESEGAICSASNENGYSLDVDHVEDGVSESEVIIELIEGRQNTPGLDESTNNAESLILPGNCMRTETEAGNLLIKSDEGLISSLDGDSIVPDVGTEANLSISPSSALDDMRPETEIENIDAKCGEDILARPVDDPKSEMEVGNGLLNGDCIANDVRSAPVIDNAINDQEEKVSMLPSEDASIKTEVSNEVSERATCQPTSPVDDPESEIVVGSGPVDGDFLPGRPANDVRSEPVTANDINDQEEKVSMLPSDDASIKAEVCNGISERATCQPASTADDPKSEIKVGNDPMDGDCLSGRTANDVRSEPVTGNAINDQEEKVSMLPSDDASIKAEVSNGVSERSSSRPTSPIDEPKSEIKVGNGVVDGDCLSGRPANDVRADPVTGNAINLEEKASTLPTEDASIRLEVSDGVSECASSQPIPAHLNDSVEKGSSLPTCPGADVKSESVVKNTSACGADKQICQESESFELIHRDETATISQEDSNANVSDGQDASTDVVKRPFYFLIRVPRYDDENLREQIKYAQQQVEDKTQIRDAIRPEIQNERASCKEYSDNFEAAISEERTAKELLKSKRQEMDAAQSVINIAKNATSIEDIDVKIRNMEHWMQHDTLSLKKEKEFIREIKQLKQLREQFSSSMGKQDVVQQALDQRDQIEERLKALKKEVDALRENVMKAEVVTKAAKKKYHEENEKQNILQAKFRAADDIRQEAYFQLHILRKKLSEKNKNFRTYKDDEKTAGDYALAGNKEALQRLCINQVETVMEVWNKNDEFRKEYIRCNTRSTLRRLKTYDGRSLGPNEEPPVLPTVTIKRADKYINAPAGGNLVSACEKTVEPVQTQKADDKSIATLVEQKDQNIKTKKPTRPAPLESGSTTVSSNDRTEEAEEEHKPTKEEEELARKAEELRKKEEEAKLKEQRRLEEKAKAKEALERKKRISEKAQARAELKAKKEAEEKEKEREKRAKKKERKKIAIESGGSEGDSTPSSETQIESVESGTREMPMKISKRPQKASQFTKQMKSKYIPPPPLRNRSKRRMQLWMWVLLVALLLLALFFVVKGDFLYYKLGLPSFHF